MFHTLIPLCNKFVLSRILGKKITSVDLRILKKITEVIFTYYLS